MFTDSSAKNAVTGEPYAGLTYYVVQKKTGLDGEEFKTMATGTLNADGEAFLTMKLKKAHAYGVRVEEPSNICYFNELAFHFGNQESNFEAHFEYAECGYLKIHVDNIDCQGANDRILFDFEPTYIDNYSNIIPREEFGCYSNEFISSKVPYGSWQATWEVTKNGNTTYYDSLFFINEGEEYVFEINY